MPFLHAIDVFAAIMLLLMFFVYDAAISLRCHAYAADITIFASLFFFFRRRFRHDFGIDSCCHAAAKTEAFHFLRYAAFAFVYTRRCRQAAATKMPRRVMPPPPPPLARLKMLMMIAFAAMIAPLRR